MGAYNFEKNILSLSKTTNPKKLKNEWTMLLYMENTDGHCICNRKIGNVYYFTNIHTGKVIEVGTACKKKLKLANKSLFKSLYKYHSNFKGIYVEIKDLDAYSEEVKRKLISDIKFKFKKVNDIICIFKLLSIAHHFKLNNVATQIRTFINRSYDIYDFLKITCILDKDCCEEIIIELLKKTQINIDYVEKLIAFVNVQNNNKYKQILSRKIRTYAKKITDIADIYTLSQLDHDIKDSFFQELIVENYNNDINCDINMIMLLKIGIYTEDSDIFNLIKKRLENLQVDVLSIKKIMKFVEQYYDSTFQDILYKRIRYCVRNSSSKKYILEIYDCGYISESFKEKYIQHTKHLRDITNFEIEENIDSIESIFEHSLTHTNCCTVYACTLYTKLSEYIYFSQNTNVLVKLLNIDSDIMFPEYTICSVKKELYRMMRKRIQNIVINTNTIEKSISFVRKLKIIEFQDILNDNIKKYVQGTKDITIIRDIADANYGIEYGIHPSFFSKILSKLMMEQNAFDDKLQEPNRLDDNIISPIRKNIIRMHDDAKISIYIESNIDNLRMLIDTAKKHGKDNDITMIQKYISEYIQFTNNVDVLKKLLHIVDKDISILQIQNRIIDISHNQKL